MCVGGGREGWGSAEATEMVLNNLFYITVKFGDDHSRELEDVWAELCTCWPTNLRVILRYLFIVTGMAPTELLAYVIPIFLLFLLLLFGFCVSLAPPLYKLRLRIHRELLIVLANP